MAASMISESESASTRSTFGFHRATAYSTDAWSVPEGAPAEHKAAAGRREQRKTKRTAHATREIAPRKAIDARVCPERTCDAARGALHDEVAGRDVEDALERHANLKREGGSRRGKGECMGGGVMMLGTGTPGSARCLCAYA
eukprot:4849942-Pleurochrysis_carterae.AAC.2